MGSYKKILTIVICNATFLFTTTAQGPLTDNNVIGNKKPEFSSPNAASIARFTEFPAATYTGVPNISLPLYAVGSKNIKVPISLSYHAGGIKVDDIASDVGIGWSLLSGGCINILVNGILDEVSGFPAINSNDYSKIKNMTLQSNYAGGYMNCENALLYADPIFGADPYFIYSGGDVSFLRDAVQLNGDAEPDVYTFNFLGRSGKFIADEFGTFRTMPYSELKIERIIESALPAGYKITDENGNVYEFKQRESSRQDMLNSGFPVVTATFTRSYFLSKITTSEGEIISFYYSAHSFEYDLLTTFSRSKTSTASSCYQLNTAGDYFALSYTTSSMDAEGQRIDSIRVSTGELVKFVYSTSSRTDLPGARALDSVQYWRYLPDRSMISYVVLGHDYSTGRLTLTSVGNLQEPATELTYSATSLPSRLSYSQDSYGFYNGRSNTTLLPLDEYMEFWTGADRTVDTNYNQAGVLRKIKHPTGGSTEFIFEANEYFIPDTITRFPKVIRINKASFPDQTVSDTFSIPSNARKIRIDYTNSYDGTVIHNDYCIIHLTGPNSYSRDFLGNSTKNMPELDLEPGLYTLAIENVGSTYSAEATIYWFAEMKMPPHNEIGGGIRIKEIRKNDSTGQASMIKKFKYRISGTNNSSGNCTFTPHHIQYRDQTITSQGEICTSTYCQLIEQSSNSIAPLTFSNGNLVSYSEVSCYIQDSLRNGYSNYKYSIEENGFNNGIPSFPYAPRIIYDWTDGILKEQTDFVYFNGQFKKVKASRFYYNYDLFNPSNDTTIIFKAFGAKVGVQVSPFVCWTPCLTPPLPNTIYGDLAFGIQYYKFYSSWHRIERTEEINYDYKNNDSISLVTKYSYESPGNIHATSIAAINSIGDSIIQRFKYPKDYNAFGFIQNLLTKNAIALPIEKLVIKKDGSNNQFVVGGEIITYNDNAPLPNKIYRYTVNVPVEISSFVPSSMNSVAEFTMDNAYREFVSINGYDQLGNVREYQKTSDVKYSYIWDHLLTKPVAEAVNADTSSIAYTSFEADSKGGWVYSGASTSSHFMTGERSYDVTGGNITKSGLNSTTYIVSYWGKNGSVYVNGGGPTRTGKVIGDWAYYEHEISTASITISGSKHIDELRLYPKGAQMKTYTYKPFIGITSECDVANRIVYYEYDTFNRLKTIKDEDGRILRRIDYKYQSNYLQ